MASRTPAWRAGAAPPRLEGGEAHGGGRRDRGPLEAAPPGLGNNPENPLRADEEPIRGRAGPRGGEPPGLDRPRRGDDPQRLDQIVDVGVEGGVVAAGSGGDPASEGRALERLGEVAQREPGRAELVLEDGAEGAGLDAGRPGGGVDLEDPVEAREVDGDDPGVAARLRSVALH